MNTKIRRSSWIVTVPLAAAALAYLLLFLLPGNRAIGELRQQIRQKRDFIEIAASMAKTLGTLRTQREQAASYSAACAGGGSTSGGISAIFGEINDLATAAGTTVTRFDPEPVVSYDKIKRIPLTMGCVGSFAEICTFLRRLEELPAMIWVETLRVEKIDKNSESVSCEINLVVFAGNPEDSD